MHKINMMIVIVLSLCVTSSFGIKCFFCKSNTNKDCENNLAYVKTENCTYARITSKGGDLLATDLLEDHLPMACSKTVFTIDGGEKGIIRGCFFIHKNPCDLIIPGITGKNIEHCSICDTDLCNSADLSKVSTSIIVVLTFFMILKSISTGFKSI